MTPNGFAITAQLPIEPNSLQESHTFFVGPDHSGLAPVRHRCFRSCRQYWCLPRYITVMAKCGRSIRSSSERSLAQADSTLTTLFSGKDFAEDILGVIEPHLQLVVAKQTETKP